MTLKNNRVPLLSNIKLWASFHWHMWIQTGVTVRKRLNGVMTSVTLTFDLWLWPFARTSCLSMVIIPENFRMIRWQEHCQKGVTDGQTDRQTDGNKKVLINSCLVAAKKYFDSRFYFSPIWSIYNKSPQLLAQEGALNRWTHGNITLWTNTITISMRTSKDLRKWHCVILANGDVVRVGYH